MHLVTLALGVTGQQGYSGGDLLDHQRSRSDYSPALVDRISDMGRCWLLLSSGEFPVQPMSGEVNININLQVAHGEMGDVPEAMAPYYDWIESQIGRASCRERVCQYV